jgi:hypothetical protein
MQDRHTKLLPFGSEWTGNLTLTNKWRRVDQGGLNDIREWVEETRAAGRKVAFIAVDVRSRLRLQGYRCDNPVSAQTVARPLGIGPKDNSGSVERS